MVERNTTEVKVSGLAFFVVYSVLDTRLWNNLDLSRLRLSLSQSLTAFNRFYGVALDLVTLLLGSILLNAVSISSIYSSILIMDIPITV